MPSHLSTTTISQIKELPIIDVAKALGIIVKGKQSLCYNGHDKNSLSLTFTPKKGLYKCFGCGEGGDSITLVMKARQVNFKIACDWLISTFKITNYDFKDFKHTRKSIPSKTTQKIETNEFVPNSEIYESIVKTLTLSKQAEKYLQEKRGFRKDIINSLEIRDIVDPPTFFSGLMSKWGPEALLECGIARQDEKNNIKCVWWGHVLVFPFTNLDYRVNYLQARIISPSKYKYINLNGVSSSIYNLHQLPTFKRGDNIFICEGIPDTITAIQNGLNAVGILGANGFKDPWARYFLDFSISIIPDTDNGGNIFAKKLREAFIKVGKMVKIIELPKEVKDLNELLNR